MVDHYSQLNTHYGIQLLANNQNPNRIQSKPYNLEKQLYKMVSYRYAKTSKKTNQETFTNPT